MNFLPWPKHPESIHFDDQVTFLEIMGIPVKVGSDSDLNPVAGSEVKPGVFGAKRRWRSYRA